MSALTETTTLANVRDSMRETDQHPDAVEFRWS